MAIAAAMKEESANERRVSHHPCFRRLPCRAGRVALPEEGRAMRVRRDMPWRVRILQPQIPLLRPSLTLLAQSTARKNFFQH